MPLRTTVIGSYRKPDYFKQPNWFSGTLDVKQFTKSIQSLKADPMYDVTLERAIREVIKEQSDLGIDVITDGELNRENYIHYLCRNISGFDFVNTKKMVYRNGTTEGVVPVIRTPVSHTDNCMVSVIDWLRAKRLTNEGTELKMTLPGPMTIVDSTYDDYYKNRSRLFEDIVTVLRNEVEALVSAGCKHVQIDEPVFVRYPQEAIEYGADYIDRIFQNVGNDVTKTLHMCCGYPDYLDEENHVKADSSAYFKMATRLNSLNIDQISLEDGHRRNDLDLFTMFPHKTIVLGTFDVAKSRIETVDEISSRIREVLGHLPADRLVIAPDCGLGFLPAPILRQKLQNMITAAKTLG